MTLQKDCEMTILTGFDADVADVNGVQIAYAKGGAGPPVLLLHGFPQTHAMWHAVAPLLAPHFTVIAADLRGYGDSSKPRDAGSQSFGNMAADQRALMAQLGYDRFHLVGHDRGGRTAHRLALESPAAVQSLTVMDIIPTHMLLNDLSQSVARAYYHWFFLAQPSPLPENMIATDPDSFFQSCLLGWGSAKLNDFDPRALGAYRKAWREHATIYGMCADYRDTLDVDFEQDAGDLDKQITCPALVMYGADGSMAQTYDVPATWAPRLANMQSTAIPGSHFFIDQYPDQTAEALLTFLRGQ